MKSMVRYMRRLDDFRGDAALYELRPPLPWRTYDDDGQEVVRAARWVIASTSVALGSIETYLFAANSNGEIDSWGELDGSMKNCASHLDCFAKIGYRFVGDETWHREAPQQPKAEPLPEGRMVELDD